MAKRGIGYSQGQGQVVMKACVEGHITVVHGGGSAMDRKC